MAARKRTWTPDIVRQRIRTSMLVNRLTNHVLGTVELTQSQVTAAQVLLKKSLPDLSAVEHSGNIDTRTEKDLTDAELASIAAGSSARAVESTGSKKEPGEIH